MSRKKEQVSKICSFLFVLVKPKTLAYVAWFREGYPMNRKKIYKN